YLTPVADLLLQMPWQGTSTFSVGDWKTRRRVITSYEGRPITQPTWTLNANAQGDIYQRPDNIPDELAWISLDAPALDPDPLTTPDQNGNMPQRDRAISQVMAQSKVNGAWGIVRRTGDTRNAVTPDWSHDGATVAYTSADDTLDGHLDQATQADIYT